MRKDITCIAIDDEPIALSVIGQFCSRYGGISLTAFSDPDEGMKAIAATRPQLVFLDIRIGERNGLEIARRLPEECCLILTTAFAEYAIEGFELDAADFLYKPFSYERFSKAVEKAMRRISSRGPQQEVLVVKQEYSNVSVPLADILYIEAMENYSKIHRSSAACVMTRTNLKNIGELLPPDQFIRIHRSFIIAVDKVEGFTRREVTLTGGIRLPIGRLYADRSICSKTHIIQR